MIPTAINHLHEYVSTLPLSLSGLNVHFEGRCTDPLKHTGIWGLGPGGYDGAEGWLAC